MAKDERKELWPDRLE